MRKSTEGIEDRHMGKGGRAQGGVRQCKGLSEGMARVRGRVKKRRKEKGKREIEEFRGGDR